MQQITQILFENDVNILGSVNNDSAEYGIVRMVVFKQNLCDLLHRAFFIFCENRKLF